MSFRSRSTVDAGWLGVAEPERAQVFPSKEAHHGPLQLLWCTERRRAAAQEGARVRDVELVDEDLHLVPQGGAVEEFVADKR